MCNTYQIKYHLKLVNLWCFTFRIFTLNEIFKEKRRQSYSICFRRVLREFQYLLVYQLVIVSAEILLKLSQNNFMIQKSVHTFKGEVGSKSG